jgi:hypothetical protein
MTRTSYTRLSLVAAIVATGALAPAATAGSRTETLRFFDKPVSITLTQPDGTVVRHAPYPEAQSGDVLDVYSLAYAGDHRRHAKRWSMSTHLRCSFGDGPPDCETHIARGNSLLIFRGDRLVAGSGRYVHATGRVVSNKTIGDSNNSDIVVRIKR